MDMADELPSRSREFADAVDLPALLARSNIEHIEVNDTRLLVIYMQAVLNLEVRDGTLDRANTLTIEMLDDPDRREADLDQLLSEFSDILDRR